MKLHPNKPVKSQQSINLNDSIVVFHKYVLLIFQYIYYLSSIRVFEATCISFSSSLKVIKFEVKPILFDCYGTEVRQLLYISGEV